jgi:hypothetical protein
LPALQRAIGRCPPTHSSDGDSASASAAADLASLLLIQVAIAWAVASSLGVLAARWGLSWRRLDGWIAFVVWLAPGIAALVLFDRQGAIWPTGGALTIGICAGVFGLVANQIRKHYRHTSEARRLVLRFWALLAAVLAIYPLGAASADQATRQLVEGDYAPATQAAQQPEVLSESLSAARADIDAIRTSGPPARAGSPSAVVRSPPGSGTGPCCRAASRRRSSCCEAEPALVSRFGPACPNSGRCRVSERTRLRDDCRWGAFIGEVARFRFKRRRMLHTERGLCAGDEFLGAVVIPRA